MSIPKYFYHLTVKKWHQKKVLHPRIWGYNRAPDEPDISRITVSDNIRGCLVAIHWYAPDKVYVYRTLRKTGHYVRPYDVEDAYITGEKWITKTTTFVKVGTIKDWLIDKVCIEVGKGCFTLGNGESASENWQKRTIKWLRKKPDSKLMDRA